MDSVQYQRKLVRCNSTLDIISDLPTNIQHNILMCLPMKDAARTSILSWKWRSQWHYIPELVFDYEHFLQIGLSKSRNDHIYQILLLHRGPLCKFVLSASYVMDMESYFIDQLLLFLTGKDVKELSLCPPSNILYRLPSVFFQCKELIHFSLSECIIAFPPNFIGFSKLISAELCFNVVDDTANFNLFISKCPLLEKLKMVISWMNTSLEIDAPNLKFLYFNCGNALIDFKNVPVLSKVIIERYDGPQTRTHNDNVVTKVFGSLPAIEHLCACAGFLTYLSAGITRKRFPIVINHLRSVELPELCFNFPKHVECALLLISRSPNLQKLKTKAYFKPVRDQLMSQVYKDISQAEDSLNKLQEVTMENFRGTVPEVEFLKFILARSLVLEKTIIRPLKGFPAHIERESLIALTRLQRASPKAEIIYSVSE